MNPVKSFLVVLWAVIFAVAVCENESYVENYRIELVLNSQPTLPPELVDRMHGVKMGIPSTYCDDGKTALWLDWDGNPVNYTCNSSAGSLPVNKSITPVEKCVPIPERMSQHICMHSRIIYSEPFPVSGAHRPLWPKYGEYSFLPPQRWLHSLEHGAIVMLYHPCANEVEVELVKNYVRKCIRRRIISPSNMVPEDRPILLMAWGCRFFMNYADEVKIKNFIQSHALHSPESKNYFAGSYSFGLLNATHTVKGSDLYDHILCPEE